MNWSKEAFNALRQKTDPIADRVIEEIIETSGLDAINTLFTQLRENDDILNIDFSQPVKDYFLKTSKLPDWIDDKKVLIGQTVFAKYGPEISLCLLCKSLPEAYACSNGAQVLYKTGRLTEQDGSLAIFTRRLMETSQFVVNVCTPGGLDPNGKGIITAQKIRLIHAAIRYYLKNKDWPSEEYGEPINQQDMAGTLQSFSALTLDGLETLSISLTEEEKDGYYHSWRVVGYIMGLEEELNPPTYEEGTRLGKAILKDQIKPSPEGVALTEAVCHFMTNLLPGNLFKHTPEAIMRFLIGDEIAEILELNTANNLVSKIIPRLLGVAFHSIEETEKSNSFVLKIIEHVNLHLLQSMLNHFNEDKQIRFYIPPNLRGDWNLN